MDEETRPATGSENEADPENDSASDFSLDSFEMDDSHMTDDPVTCPTWLRQLPAGDLIAQERTSELESSTSQNSRIYQNFAILDADPSDDINPWIRLLRIKADLFDQPIRCTILRKRLWEEGDYYALSYSWGKEPLSKTIYVDSTQLAANSTPFVVSKHLWTALQKLRNAHHDTTVWIDAICIDQQNFMERAAQVRIMAQIFNQASEVMVWLGNSKNHRTDKMDTAERFWVLCHVHSPWWTRLWVVQECAYARKCPVVMLDDDRLSMQKFIEHLDRYMSSETEIVPPVRIKEMMLNLELLRMPFDAWTAQTKDNRHLMPLLERLRQTSGRHCTDPRDRIYALLGLIDEAEARMIKLDYRKQYSELLLEVAEGLNHYPYSDTGHGSALYELLEKEDLLATALVNRNTVREYSNAIEKALQGEHHRAAQILLRKWAKSTNHCVNLLHTSAEAGHVMVVKLLLGNYAIPNPQEALFGADQHGHLAIVKLFAEHQVHAHAGRALNAAINGNCLDIVKQLLEHGADTNVTDIEFGDKTALFAASKKGYVDIVRLLLKHQANPNIQNRREGTPLYVAAQNGDLEIVKLLLDNNAETPVGFTGEFNAIRAASERGHTEIAWLIQETHMSRLSKRPVPSSTPA